MKIKMKRVSIQMNLKIALFITNTYQGANLGDAPVVVEKES
ncbi:hypothetical protein [Halalkalibacter akibai]|nr:hypothetical protein [Halalkalibacter akibai]